MAADELRESWQGRALEYVRRMPQLGPVVLSLLADNFDDTLPALLRAVFPEMTGIRTPAYCANPKIDKHGRIVCDMAMPNNTINKNSVVFVSELQMQSVFRVFADRLKLSDVDRIELFNCVRHWVKADMRLDPTMDRNDPDAKRLRAN